MNFSVQILAELCELAISAARAAGVMINASRQQSLQIERKAVGSSEASQVATEVDRRVQAVILDILQPSCVEYDLALLAEESSDDCARLVKPAFWCIDPLDGTLAFINHQPGFSVSIALVARDGSPLIGVVYDPVTHHLYHAIVGQGAFLDGQSLRLPSLDPHRPLILQTDFSFERHPWREQTLFELERLAEALGLSGAKIEYRIGAVLNACSILEDANRCYFKFPRSDDSGGSLWDYAATACLFVEAGGVASDLEGQPMVLNRAESTFMNHRGIVYLADRSLLMGIRQLFEQLS